MESRPLGPETRRNRPSTLVFSAVHGSTRQYTGPCTAKPPPNHRLLRRFFGAGHPPEKNEKRRRRRRRRRRAQRAAPPEAAVQGRGFKWRFQAVCLRLVSDLPLRLAKSCVHTDRAQQCFRVVVPRRSRDSRHRRPRATQDGYGSRGRRVDDVIYHSRGVRAVRSADPHPYSCMGCMPLCDSIPESGTWQTTLLTPLYLEPLQKGVVCGFNP